MLLRSVITGLMASLLFSQVAAAQVYHGYMNDQGEIMHVRHETPFATIDNKTAIEMYRQHYERRRKSFASGVPAKLVRDESLQRYIQLTASQVSTLKESYKKSEDLNKSDYAEVKDKFEQYGKGSAEVKELQTKTMDRYRTNMSSFNESFEATILPFQKELLSRYMALEMLNDTVPKKHALYRPYLLTEAIGLTKEERKQVLEESFKAKKELDANIREAINEAYKKILSEVPVKTRKTMLEILTETSNLSNPPVLGRKAGTIEEESKRVKDIYAVGITELKARLATNMKLQDQVQITQTQLDQLKEALNEIAQQYRQESDKVSVELRISREQLGSGHEETEKLIEQSKAIDKKVMESLTLRFNKILLPFQKDLLDKLARRELIRTRHVDEMNLYWPYMLAVTYDMDDEILKSIKSKTKSVKPKLDKKVKQLKEQAEKQAIDSYPQDKRDDLKELLATEIKKQ